MLITKRNGLVQEFDKNKITGAIKKSFAAKKAPLSEEKLCELYKSVEEKIDAEAKSGREITVEKIQDYVESALMHLGYFEIAKAYILYREERAKKRRERKKLCDLFHKYKVEKIFKQIQNEYSGKFYSVETLFEKMLPSIVEEEDESERYGKMLNACVDLTTLNSPKWEEIAARLLYFKFETDLFEQMSVRGINSFYDKIKYMTEQGLYGKYILDSYTKEEIDAFENAICSDRVRLLSYAGLDALLSRFVIKSKTQLPLETPEELFMGVSMHLNINETTDRSGKVIALYDGLSKLKVYLSSPLLKNARRERGNFSSAFCSSVPDSLDGIMNSVENFAKVSGYGGAMGLYFGKVRASGSKVRGVNIRGGVERWIKILGATANAVEQLGVREGAVTAYLDVWHKDLLEFIKLARNGENTHIRTAICFPDLFWKQAAEDLDSSWYLMCPEEIKNAMGYNLSDYFGREWELRYKNCVKNHRLLKREIKIRELLTLVTDMQKETSFPMIFNRDTVNEFNANSHKGKIYCSSFCGEIAENVRENGEVTSSNETVDGNEIIVEKRVKGDFASSVLCGVNLSVVESKKDLMESVSLAVRTLDNALDLNDLPLLYATAHKNNYRGISLSVAGYEEVLVDKGLKFESEENIQLSDSLFEDINYYALAESVALAKEKGAYPYFEDSDYYTGEYFTKRRYKGEKWVSLFNEMKKYGLRNGYLIALSPTSTASVIANTTESINLLENCIERWTSDKKHIVRLPKNLSRNNCFAYKTAFDIDQKYVVAAAGARSRHIDQSQALKLYVTDKTPLSEMVELFVKCNEAKIKTVYAIVNKKCDK